QKFQGIDYLVKIDLEGYFDTINHEILMEEFDPRAEGGGTDKKQLLLRVGRRSWHRNLKRRGRKTTF
ncbi:MAG: hypothetical protein Q8755_03080, partial [Candidatus Phytoplasma australasiaticum]|nr:hypothetical protein [Candidatus Phytoplasma australasiaticum]